MTVPGSRRGIYVFQGAGIGDFAPPHGAFSAARRDEPGLAGRVDAGRISNAGGITCGMGMGFHLLRRAGYEGSFVAEVARVMEYSSAYRLYRDDIETLAPEVSGVTSA